MADGAATPQWDRLRRDLLDGIASGRWPVGGQLPTEAEIAALSGVSRITVRRALHELRAAGVVATARGRRTRVLRAGPESEEPLDGLKVVAFSVPRLANAHILALMRGVEGELRRRGCTAVIIVSDNDPARERRQVSLARHLGVAGLVVYPAQGAANAAFFQEIARARLPLVYVGRHHQQVAADRVGADNAGAAAAAVDSLLRRGHRRIVFVNEREREVSAVTERLQGYCQAHERHRLPVDFRLVLMDLLAREVGEGEAAARIGALWAECAPTAALAVNEAAARAFDRHVRALGLRCEIAAFTAAAAPEPMAGLAVALPVPAEAMGREAASILARRIGGDWEGWPVQRVVPVDVLVAPEEGAAALG